MRICQRQNKLALWGAAESAHSKIESMKSSRPMREEQPSPEHSASLTHSASATSVASFSSHTSTIALYSLRLSDMYCALDMNITSLSLPLAILSWRWAVSHQTCNACLTCGASRSASRCSTADDVFIDSRPCKWKGTNDVEDCLSRTSWLLRKSCTLAFIRATLLMASILPRLTDVSFFLHRRGCSGVAASIWNKRRARGGGRVSVCDSATTAQQLASEQRTLRLAARLAIIGR